jgi:hypothetical protein
MICFFAYYRPKPQLTHPNPPLIHPHLLEKHNIKLGLMKGSTTKIITPRSTVPKKISFNVHPSHEAAARKANQNISKLLTPSELAQKRLQRTRLVGETGTLSGISIPRSTPSPNPPSSSVSNSQSNNNSMMVNSSSIPNGGSTSSLPYNPMNASTAAQQVAAGMMRSGYLRPPMMQKSSNNQLLPPPNNPMMAQLQQLQQLQNQFGGDSPSKTNSTNNVRPNIPSGQNQSRPLSGGNNSFMNLPPGITQLQMQQFQQQQQQQQKQSQINQQQQLYQQQQLHASQMQQLYAKSLQSRPPVPSSTTQSSKNVPTQSRSPSPDPSSSNLRTSPRKSHK